MTPDQIERVRALESFIRQSASGIAGGQAFVTSGEDADALTALLAEWSGCRREDLPKDDGGAHTMTPDQIARVRQMRGVSREHMTRDEIERQVSELVSGYDMEPEDATVLHEIGKLAARALTEPTP